MSEFPEIEDAQFREKAPDKAPKMKVVCEKHGEINDAYIFNVHMPDHGFDHVSYCLVCAMEYLQMIATEVQFVPVKEEESEQ